MTQNELNTIVNDIKNKSINFADKYICDVLINNPNPMQKIKEMIKDSFYPNNMYKLDKEVIDDYLKTDIYDHPYLNSDTFELLTPKEQSIVCNLYFNHCLVGIHVELELNNVTFEGVN